MDSAVTQAIRQDIEEIVQAIEAGLLMYGRKPLPEVILELLEKARCKTPEGAIRTAEINLASFNISEKYLREQGMSRLESELESLLRQYPGNSRGIEHVAAFRVNAEAIVNIAAQFQYPTQRFEMLRLHAENILGAG